jgi:hypothetical protein
VSAIPSLIGTKIYHQVFVYADSFGQAFHNGRRCAASAGLRQTILP